MRYVRRRALRGFTMVELMLVIVTVGVLGIIALPKFLNFAEEGRVASATQATNVLKGAVAIKKQQMMLQCNLLGDAWPCLDAINQNDIRACGQCTSEQVSDEDAKFLTNTGLPDYMQNGNTAIVACSCENSQNSECFPSGASYCFWEGDIRLDPRAGRIIAGMANGGIEQYANNESSAGGGGGESSSMGGGGESSSDSGISCDAGHSVGGDTLCYDACEQVVSDTFCLEGGSSSEADACTNSGGTWDGESCACSVTEYYEWNEPICLRHYIDGTAGPCGTAGLDYAAPAAQCCNNAGIQAACDYVNSSSSSSSLACSMMGNYRYILSGACECEHEVYVESGFACVPANYYSAVDISYCQNPELNLAPPESCNSSSESSGGPDAEACTSAGGSWDGSNCNCPAQGWHYGAWDGSSCIGCWNWQTFNGTYCEETGQQSCESGGGSWDSSSGNCTCPEGTVPGGWNGYGCDSSGGGSSSEGDCSGTAGYYPDWNGTECVCNLDGTSIYIWDDNTQQCGTQAREAWCAWGSGVMYGNPREDCIANSSPCGTDSNSNGYDDCNGADFSGGGSSSSSEESSSISATVAGSCTFLYEEWEDSPNAVFEIYDSECSPVDAAEMVTFDGQPFGTCTSNGGFASQRTYAIAPGASADFEISYKGATSTVTCTRPE